MGGRFATSCSLSACALALAAGCGARTGLPSGAGGSGAAGATEAANASAANASAANAVSATSTGPVVCDPAGPPVVLANDTSLGTIPGVYAAGAGIIAMDDLDLYYLGPVALNRQSKEGGSVTELAPAAGLVFVNVLALDDQNVFVDDGDSHIVSVPKVGGALNPIASVGQAEAIAVDGERVYWIDHSPVSGPSVHSAPKDGSSQVMLAGPYADAVASALTTDDTSVYFATVDVVDLDATIWRVPKPGGAPEPIAKALQAPDRIVATADDLYWSDAGGIVRMAKAGGAPETIVPFGGGMSQLVLMIDGFYWISNQPDREESLHYTLWHAPLEGGGATKLAESLGAWFGGAVADAGAYYWTRYFPETPPDGPASVLKKCR